MVMEGLLKIHNLKEGLSRPESRTRAMGSKLQSVRFGRIKNKSCPANGPEVGVQSTEFPVTRVDKHKLDGLLSLGGNKGSTQRSLKRFNTCIRGLVII